MHCNLRRRAIWVGAVYAAIAVYAGPPAYAQGISNKAKVSVSLVPSSIVAVGNTVAFEVRSARRGYVLLVDVDPQGRMAQVFPNVELLERLKGGDEMNLIQANGKIIVPSEEIRKKGFYYLASEPKGTAAIVAIFSPRKVQLIDLPDFAEVTEVSKSVERLLRWVDELRIADPDSGKLLTNDWSSDTKSYEIR